MGSVCDWLKQIFIATRPIRSLTQIWVVIRYGISVLVPQTSFRWETSDSRNVNSFLRLSNMINAVLITVIVTPNWKLRALFCRTRSRDLKIIKSLLRRIKNNYECALLQRELGLIENTQYEILYQFV